MKILRKHNLESRNESRSGHDDDSLTYTRTKQIQFFCEETAFVQQNCVGVFSCRRL